MTSTTGCSVPLKPTAAFLACIMTCVAYVSLPVPRLVRVEVIERLLSTSRHRAGVTVMRIVPVIYVPIESPWAMKPPSRSNKDATIEPVRPVVAVG